MAPRFRDPGSEAAYGETPVCAIENEAHSLDGCHCMLALSPLFSRVIQSLRREEQPEDRDAGQAMAYRKVQAAFLGGPHTGPSRCISGVGRGDARLMPY